MADNLLVHMLAVALTGQDSTDEEIANDDKRTNRNYG